MYFPDGQQYSYNLPDGLGVPGTACVGWLDPSVEFPEGQVGPVFLEALRRVTAEYSVNQFRGNHPCYFCAEAGVDVFLEVDGNRRLVLGSAEIWIRSLDTPTVFVAPSLLLHYVEVHRYEPPQRFQDAVEAYRSVYERWDPRVQSESLIDQAFAGWRDL